MSTSAVDNEAVATGWFALPTATNQAFLLVDHQTIGVDERGELTETSREATHACRVRRDRGILRIETIRGEVSINGRRVSKRALLSDSGVLRLGQEAFFLSEQALAAEPVEVVSELPGIWQPFIEEMEIDEIEAIPEPGHALAPRRGPFQSSNEHIGANEQPITVPEPHEIEQRAKRTAARPEEPKGKPARRVPVVALFALIATVVFTAILLLQTLPPSTASIEQAPAAANSSPALT